MKLALTFLLILTATPTFALTCRNDYAGSSGCAANSSAVGNCETLGFSKADVKDCLDYLYCPFDLAYKRCVPHYGSSCEAGYSTDYQSVLDCGSSGTSGWIFTSNGQSGNKKCGKCTAKSCPVGTASIVMDCGNSGNSGWYLGPSSLTNYSGNEPCSLCTKKSCASGYVTSVNNCGTTGSLGWSLTQNYSGYSGEDKCFKCMANTCPGFSSNTMCITKDTLRCYTCYTGNQPTYQYHTCFDLGYKYDCPEGCTNDISGGTITIITGINQTTTIDKLHALKCIRNPADKEIDSGIVTN